MKPCSLISNALRAGITLACLVSLTGCTRHKITTTHHVDPIHITIDINLKIDRELDAFFGPVDAAAETPAELPVGETL